MRLLKRIVEMVFIFLVPLMLLLFGLKINKVYDENNNLTSQYLTYENGIFREYNENLQYKNYIHFNQLYQFPSLEYSIYYKKVNDYTLEFIGSSYYNIGNYLMEFPSDSQGHIIYMYYESSSPITTPSTYFIYWSYNLGANFSGIDTTSKEYYGVLNYDENTTIQIRCYPEDNIGIQVSIQYFDLTKMFGNGYEPSLEDFKSEYINKYYNYVEEDVLINLSNDIISNDFEINYTWYNNALVSLSNHLQFNNNFMIQIIFIYIVLIFINLLLWYSLYVPFDMLFGLLLRKLEYYK